MPLALERVALVHSEKRSLSERDLHDAIEAMLGAESIDIDAPGAFAGLASRCGHAWAVSYTHLTLPTKRIV